MVRLTKFQKRIDATRNWQVNGSPFFQGAEKEVKHETNPLSIVVNRLIPREYFRDECRVDEEVAYHWSHFDETCVNITHLLIA